MEFIELKLIEKIGNVFAIAMTNRKYNRYQFIKIWCSSTTFQSLLDFDETLCSQAKTYILRTFEKEFADKLPDIDDDSSLYEDDMFWFGYLISYWYFLDGTTGKDIARQYDICKVLDEYDVLHTLSVTAAIRKETAVEALNCMKVGTQICVRTDKGLNNLRFERSIELSPERVAEVREINKADRRMANQLTSEIIRKHNKKTI